MGRKDRVGKAMGEGGGGNEYILRKWGERTGERGEGNQIWEATIQCRLLFSVSKAELNFEKLCGGVL